MRSDASQGGRSSSHTGSANAAEHASQPASSGRSSSRSGGRSAPNPQIVRIQRALGVNPDGKMGPATEAAIRHFQSTHGLVADGVVGPRTSAALFGGSGGGSTSSGGSHLDAHQIHVQNQQAANSAWQNTPEAKAANFGWSLAVINSNPELANLFKQASAQNWTSDYFVARVRDTHWFKTHSDTARQAAIEAKADPATYAKNVAQAMAQAGTMAGQLGATLTSAQLKQIGAESVMYGWTTDQLRQTLGGFIKAGTGGQYAGNAATYQTHFNQLASDYGVNLSPQTMATWIKNADLGVANEDQFRNYMIQQASSRYPALADRLKGGETLQQIADPYMQSYSKILEVNPNTVRLTDPLIQSALSTKDAKGQPATKSVWQFEQDLRNDPRYMQTQQAQDNAMQMAHQVLSDWGIKS